MPLERQVLEVSFRNTTVDNIVHKSILPVKDSPEIKQAICIPPPEDDQIIKLLPCVTYEVKTINTV